MKSIFLHKFNNILKCTQIRKVKNFESSSFVQLPLLKVLYMQHKTTVWDYRSPPDRHLPAVCPEKAQNVRQVSIQYYHHFLLQHRSGTSIGAKKLVFVLAFWFFLDELAIPNKITRFILENVSFSVFRVDISSFPSSAEPNIKTMSFVSVQLLNNFYIKEFFCRLSSCSNCLLDCAVRFVSENEPTG